MSDTSTPDTPEEPDRECIRCGKIRPATDFHWTAALGLRYRRAQCRDCRAVTRGSRQGERGPQERRRSKLKDRYRITEERYDAMLAAQDSRCLGCGIHADEERRRFCVDHDHGCCPGRETCGKCLRGLLCNRCNFVVGHSYDNPDTLERLAAYLRAHAEP